MTRKTKRLLIETIIDTMVLLALYWAIAKAVGPNQPQILAVMLLVWMLAMWVYFMGKRTGKRVAREGSLVAGVVVSKTLFDLLAERVGSSAEAMKLYEGRRKTMDDKEIIDTCFEQFENEE